MIFSEIVIWYYHKWPSSTIYDTPTSNPSALLPVSQVCKRWREISLSHKWIWASAINVDLVKPRWAQELVRRAEDVPLVIHWYNKEHSHPFRMPIWRYVFENMDSWGALFLQTCISCGKAQLSEALTQPAPKLESVVICNEYVPNEHEHEHSSYGPFVLPNDLFDGCAPQLRKFATSKVDLLSSFEFSVWNRLTALSVIGQNLGGPKFRIKIRAKQWLEGLRGLTQLEYLQLGWVVPMWGGRCEPDSSLAHIPDVHLDRLRVLQLSATSERDVMFDIFVKLIVPDACSTSVDASYDTMPPDADLYRLQAGLGHRLERWLEVGSNSIVNPFQVTMLQNNHGQDPRSISFGFEIKVRNLDTRLISDQAIKPPNFKFQYHCLRVRSGDKSNPTPFPLAWLLKVLKKFHLLPNP